MKQFPDGKQLEWNRDNDNFGVLQRSDILISDFSGVTFDFSLVFDKPIIYADASVEWDIYDACWLEEKPWTFRILPKLGMQLTEENLPEMKQIIDSCIEDPSYAEGRKQAREETWACIGRSAELTADYLIEKRQSLLAEEQ